VRQGESFGLLGPNEASKTTTVRMLIRLLKPSGGKAYVVGFDVAKDPVEVKARIGVVSDTANPYLEMTVWDNLMFSYKKGE